MSYKNYKKKYYRSPKKTDKKATIDVSGIIDKSTKLNNIKTYSTCCPKCIYFPNLENSMVWEVDENGVKCTTFEYICGFDGHKIVNWTDKCPREAELKNLKAQDKEN